MYNLDLDLQQIIRDRLHVSLSDIEAYCQRWQITEFALFGSVLRDDFRPDSDVDVLITFAPSLRWSLFDLMEMQKELETAFGRKVDLVQKKELKNPYRRANILKTHRVVYANQ
ncbi:nucleotidyltransferase family protein [Trichocoleus sp. FACHB-591]|uniref:nucleotidyltransferase family protein n=1 Tax=Trichocoleus sp. FACHB-591 TaxID=2692872 RepID=UPI0016876BA4|nr:nucleotidyltransferase family protein [Trichocoleus sp. FACHB-591]MBD2097669.1 nucleotidyltransferase family protein [Trichocoleus sp. FACHB-591]